MSDAADAVCKICLEADGLTLGQVCACRGSTTAHLECLINHAKHRWPRLDAWRMCLTCKCPFTGQAQMGLALALWERSKDMALDSQERLSAAEFLANALWMQARPPV